MGIYCFPLAMTGNRPDILDLGTQPAYTLQNIFKPTQALVELPVCEGFEMPLGSIWQDPDTKKWHYWSERWLVILCGTATNSGIGATLE